MKKDLITAIVIFIFCAFAAGIIMYPKMQAQLAEKRALQFQMQAQLVQAQALAFSANTIAAQSWIWIFLFSALIICVIVVIVMLLKSQAHYIQPPPQIKVEKTIERVVIVLPSSSHEARRLIDNLRNGHAINAKKYEVLDV